MFEKGLGPCLPLVNKCAALLHSSSGAYFQFDEQGHAIRVAKVSGTNELSRDHFNLLGCCTIYHVYYNIYLVCRSMVFQLNRWRILNRIDVFRLHRNMNPLGI